ncbi:MAG: efflux RND transporter periplasmic adaptor subunit [Bacteroidota bacterium]|nr:efflux RND transporter periplasmic adaptor subunit [Bacteroidota bacterium]
MRIFKLLPLITVIVACNKKPIDNAPKEKPPVMVDVLIAQYSDVENQVILNGSVIADESVYIFPEVSGRLTYLEINEGNFVNKGTILAKINNAELVAQLNLQKNQLDLLSKTEERQRKLLETNSVSQAEYDAALTQLNNIKSNIQVLEAQIDKTIIKAPFSGNLGLRNVSPGAYVTPQTLICNLQKTDKIKIDFNVPETYISLINKGKKIKVQMNDKDKYYTAQISAIEPSVNTTTRNLKVRALAESSDLMPGTFVKVYLNSVNKKSIQVPTNAIIPDAISSKLVLVKENKAKFTPVTTGNRNKDMIEITSGIVAGDSVLVSGMLFVRPGAPIKVRKIKNYQDFK